MTTTPRRSPKAGRSKFPDKSPIRRTSSRCKADARWLPLPAGVMQLGIIDPPYNVMHLEDMPRKGMSSIRRGIAWDQMTTEAYHDLILLSARELWRVADPNGATLYCFCPGEDLGVIRDILVYAGWTWRLPNYWHKKNPAPIHRARRPQQAMEAFGMATLGKNYAFNVVNGGLAHNIFEHPIVHHTHRVHPTQKPLGLLLDLVGRSSRPGELVVDSFAGSGVALDAALQLERKAFGCDLAW